jgi:hypothetical protein
MSYWVTERSVEDCLRQARVVVGFTDQLQVSKGRHGVWK